MKNSLHKTLSMLAICLLLSQTLLGSLPVFAQTNSNELTIIMTENGQPYVEGNVATSPVTIQVAITSPDSAGIELSQDLGATWKSYDPTEPLLLEDTGEHDIWFRVTDQTVIEKRRIQIATAPMLSPPTSQLSSLEVQAIANKESDFKIENSIGGVSISKYIGQSTDVVIPDTIGGKLVTEIGTSAFDNKKLESVIIPESVTRIGHSAFSGNQLKNVIIPEGVKSIEKHAFSSNLLESVTIPENVSSIGSFAFSHNKLKSAKILAKAGFIGDHAFYLNQLESVTMSESLKYIGNNAFSENQLKNVTIPDNIVSINVGTFSKNKLESVTIPESVTRIESGAFSQNLLKSVTIPESIKEIGGGAFSNNQLESVTIPEGITVLESGVFAGNLLKSVVIPATVTSIESSAFSKNRLESVTIPEGVTKIGIQAFTENLLKRVIIPESVTSIGSSAFSGNQLESVVIPGNVANIGVYTFSHNKLKSVVIPASVTNIEYGAFYQNQLESVTIPASVTSIGGMAFYQNKLEDVTIPEGVTIIDKHTFAENQLKSVTIPTSVTKIGDSAFSKNQLENVTIPASVTSIGESAFSYNKLESATIPESVTSIGAYAFFKNRLKNVTIPESIISIEKYTFSDNQLENVIIPASVKRIVDYAFSSNQLHQVQFNGKLTISPYTFYGQVKPSPFIGWYVDQAYTVRWDNLVPAPMTIYSKQGYTVSYDGNGSTGGHPPVNNQLYKYGESVEVAGNTGGLERVGYTFKGWNTKTDGSGTNYMPNETFNIKLVTTMLYAKWDVAQYTLSFDTNGGSTVAKQTLAYNTKAKEPTVPTQPGYTFGGWYKDDMFTNKWNFETDVVTKDMMLYAKWGYKINYDENGATGGHPPVDSLIYKSGESVKVVGNVGSLVKIGFTFNGWNTKADGSGINYMPNETFDISAANVTLYAIWEHAVTFDPTGGTMIPGIIVATQSLIPEPIVSPTKTGAIFAGWYTDTGFKTKWNFATDVVKKNMTLYAKWEHTVTFDTNGGTAIPEIAVEPQTFIPEPIVPPTKTDSTFAGWYADAGLTTKWNFATDVVIANTTLYAKWEHTVIFDTNGGTSISDVRALTQSIILEPAVPPTKTGATFAGWYTDADLTTRWNFATDVVTRSMTLYAKWEHTVTFDTNGGTAISDVMVLSQSSISEPTVPPTKLDYTFAGWYADAGLTTKWNFATDVVTANMTLYAKWEHTVTFNTNGGTAIPEIVVEPQSFIPEPIVPPRKTDSTFAGWYADAGLTTKWNFATDVVKANMALYAKWEHTVTFNTNGGTVIPEVVAEPQSIILEPTVLPTKTGATFAGWYADADLTTKWNFGTDVVKANMTLYAKWEHTVAFNTNGGTVILEAVVESQSIILEPAIPPTKIGSTFAGWYADADLTTKWNFATDVVTESMTLYAKWEHTVTFNTNGGTAILEAVVESQSFILEPAIPPTKMGFIFAGWYVDADLTTKWSFGKDVVIANMTLYAKWEVGSYELSFESNGGSTVVTQTVAYEKMAIPPVTPMKQGSTFAGWYKDAKFATVWDFTKDVVTEPTTLYAKWTLNSTSGGDGGSYVPTPEPSPTPESEKESTPKSELESKPELKPESELESKLEPNPESEPKSTPESTPEPQQELKSDPAPIHFSDITPDYWAADFIQQAAAMGIFKGYDDGRFGPKDNLTRAQSISILVRMLQLEPSYTTSFTDIKDYTKEVQAEINVAFQLGLVKGDNGKFNPTSQITRAQFALILYRTYEMLTGKPYSPMQIAPFSDIGKYDKETKNAISMLYELGIAEGSEGNYMPSKPITRAEAAKILVNTAKIVEQLKKSSN
ncbi:InlB B-repeat-containing protein [Solibacillus sp. FSL K6-1523]|uniref:InlB B-repeat-containing protein n=1 Tax=Solibacillus sp. FSL K6-1523 TaxID=2921471 RepID=UPI0030F74E34